MSWWLTQDCDFLGVGIMSNRPSAGQKGKKKPRSASPPWGVIAAGVVGLIVVALASWLLLRGRSPVPVKEPGATPVATAPVPSPPTNPLSPVPTRPSYAPNERPVAERMLAIGANLVITDSTGSPLFVTQLNQLPELLHITGLLLDDCQQLTPEHATLIAGLSGLNDLQLARAKITDEWLAPLVRLSTLTILNVEDTALTAKSLPVIAKFTQLTFLALTLDLSDNDLAGLTTLTKLRQLRCIGSKVTNIGLKSICTACPDLTHFMTDQLAITDAGLEAIAGLPKLRMLGLMRTPVTDGGVATFQRIKTLTHLLIPGTQVTREGTAKIREALPTCQVFGGKYDLRRVIAARVLSSGGQITIKIEGQPPRTISLLDDPPEELFTCQSIDLAGTTLPEQWTLGDLLLNDAQSLSLSGSKIDIRQLAEIPARSPQLKTLDLSKTLAGDALVGPLSKLRSLQSIDVRETRFTANGIVDLRVGTRDGCEVADGEEFDPEQDRRVAESILELGGAVAIVEPGGTKVWKAAKSDLPPGRFFLREFSVNGAPEVNAAWAANLVGLRHLRSFSSEGCNYSDGTMASLAKIPTLGIIRIAWQGPQITDAGMVSLANLRHLTQLQLEAGAELGPEGIKRIGALPSLTHFNIASAKFDDEAVRLLALQYPNLTSLYCWSSTITDQGVPDLLRLKKLTNLSLKNGTKITSEGIERLLDLPELRLFDPGIVKLTPQTALKLFRHPKLAEILIQSCELPESAFVPLLEQTDRAGHLELNPKFASFKLAQQIRKQHPKLTVNRGDGVRRGCVELMLNMGSQATLTVTGQAKPVILKKGDPLPEEDFLVSKVHLIGMKEPPAWFPLFALPHGGGIVELQEAVLTDCNLGGNVVMSIGPFQQLTKLDVAGIKVTDDHIDRMPTMPNLKSLDLRRTEITAPAVLRLAARMPQCKIGVDDTIRDQIKRLQKSKK